jgi:transcriptional regulator with XRE-family HTH domain
MRKNGRNEAVMPIRAERKNRGWTVYTMAKKLRAAADRPSDVPDLETICRNIRRWEKAGSDVSERYRYMYCRAFDRTETELFGSEPPDIIPGPAGNSMPSSTGTVTSEDHEGNRYLVVTLPPGAQRIVIDLISTGEGEVTDTRPRPVPRLAIVRDAEDTAKPRGEANG